MQVEEIHLLGCFDSCGLNGQSNGSCLVLNKRDAIRYLSPSRQDIPTTIREAPFLFLLSDSTYIKPNGHTVASCKPSPQLLGSFTGKVTNSLVIMRVSTSAFASSLPVRFDSLDKDNEKSGNERPQWEHGGISIANRTADFCPRALRKCVTFQQDLESVLVCALSVLQADR